MSQQAEAPTWHGEDTGATCPSDKVQNSVLAEIALTGFVPFNDPSFKPSIIVDTYQYSD